MKTRTTLVIGLLALSLLAACASRKNAWGDPESGLILKYRPADQPLMYKKANNIIQTIDMMDQSMENTTEIGYTFSTTFSESGKEYKIDVTIDSMNLKVSGPQGTLTPDVSNIVGKSFVMTLLPLGKETSFAGIENMKYYVGQAGNRGIRSDFQTIFPDLPATPIKIGETWITQDTVSIDDSDIKTKIVLLETNKLAGFEMVNGLECVKIDATVSGTLDGSGSQGGAEFTLQGDTKSVENTWYFAYKKGLFVKSASKSHIDSKILLSVPQEMTIPMQLDISEDVILIQ